MSQEKMKFCKHCKFLRDSNGVDKCGYGKFRSPIHGGRYFVETFHAFEARASEFLCGANAKFFEEK